MTPPDKQCEEFEAAQRKLHRVYDDQHFAMFANGEYKWLAMRADFQLWQAAAALYERRGLERAREICIARMDRTNKVAADACYACADAIEREIAKC